MSESRNYRDSGLTENNMKYHNGGNSTNRLSALSGASGLNYHSTGTTPGRPLSESPRRESPVRERIVKSTPSSPARAIVSSESLSYVLEVSRTEVPEDIKDFMLDLSRISIQTYRHSRIGLLL